VRLELIGGFGEDRHVHITMMILIAFILDLFFGDPEWFPHPVVLMGKAISFLERQLRDIFPANPEGERAAGRVMAFALPVITYVFAFILLKRLSIVSPVTAWAVNIFLCYQALAVRSMLRESRNVYHALRTKSLDAARQAVARIVGRETARLNEAGIIRAAVETVAENFSDGVVAPLFYMMIGGAPLALAYKAVNTMDSMVGYRNDRYRNFGRAAAKLDDAANFIPSRIAAFLVMGAAFISGEKSPKDPLSHRFGGGRLVSMWERRMITRRAFLIWKRDRRKHESPNSAQTESAMAGALGVQLAGPAVYFGKVNDKPYIGDPLRPIEERDILRANRIFFTGSCLAVLAICLVGHI
jgi:adenosylcobinamide-phosphate synthase